MDFLHRKLTVPGLVTRVWIFASLWDEG